MREVSHFTHTLVDYKYNIYEFVEEMCLPAVLVGCMNSVLL